MKLKCIIKSVMTTAIGRMMKSPEEEYTLNAPRMSPLEGIAALHDKFQRVRDDVNQLCKLMESTKFLSEDYGHITKVLADHPVGRNTDLAWDDKSFSTWGQTTDRWSRSPTDSAIVAALFQKPVFAERVQEEDYQLVGHEREAKRTMLQPASSMKQMPVEIWMYIFELCAVADRVGFPDDAAGFNIPRAGRVPLVLCHVCKLWRRLAVGTPSLWTSFSFTLEKVPLSITNLKSSIELWLRYSRSMDLAVNLELNPTTVHVFSDHLADHVVMMLKRCHKLRINVPDEVLRTVLCTGLPRLRALEVRTSHLRVEVQSLRMRAPNLGALAVLGPSICRFSDKSIPWAQVTEYKGCCWADIQRHLDIIRMLPNLERCTLYPFYELRGGGDGVLPVRIKNLRQLQVVSYLGATIGGFLRYLEAPRIERLLLEVSEESPAFSRTRWPRGPIVEFLERSDGCLSSLELIGMQVDEEELLEVRREHCKLSRTKVIVQPL